MKTALDIENELHNFLDVRQKNKTDRDNTKRTENPYFHCGPGAEKVMPHVGFTKRNLKSSDLFLELALLCEAYSKTSFM